jgi:hypothetical protein
VTIHREPPPDADDRVLVSVRFRGMAFEIRAHHDANWLVYRATDEPGARRSVPYQEAQGLACSGPDGRCLICGSIEWRAGRNPPESGERIACSRCGYSDGSVRILITTD